MRHSKNYSFSDSRHSTLKKECFISKASHLKLNDSDLDFFGLGVSISYFIFKREKLKIILKYVKSIYNFLFIF